MNDICFYEQSRIYSRVRLTIDSPTTYCYRSVVRLLRQSGLQFYDCFASRRTDHRAESAHLLGNVTRQAAIMLYYKKSIVSILR